MSSQVDDKSRIGIWIMDELIHHPWHNFSLIYEKWRPKSYCSDIKYYMTLHIISSVVTNEPVKVQDVKKIIDVV